MIKHKTIVVKDPNIVLLKIEIMLSETSKVLFINKRQDLFEF